MRAANFDRVARVYRWAEYAALGPLLRRTRTHFVDRLKESRRALVLGDGDGRFLAELLLRNPELQATTVDSSAKMLALLRGRCGAARVETVCADALSYTPPAGVDLVVSHFFLDCFTQGEVDGLAQRLAGCVRPGALWLLSDFRVPRSGGMRVFARAYIRSLYFAFGLLTGLRVTQLPDPGAALSRAGFRPIAHYERLGGMLYTELWTLPEAPERWASESPVGVGDLELARRRATIALTQSNTASSFRHERSEARTPRTAPPR